MLQVEHICKSFGGVRALQDAHLVVRPGEIHALVGENGAGKSTLAKIIAGAVKADRGTISVDGKLAPIANPMDAQRHGISIIHQELDLFPHLTVGENMVIGNLNYDEGRTVSFRRIKQFCRPWLQLVGLGDGSAAMLSDLSISHRQLAAIARALSMNARYILMDEPTSALFGDVAERLFGVIAELKNRGVAIVYVSHKMDEIFRLCDRITVQRDGRTIGTRDVAGSNAAEIIQLMVGRELHASTRPERQPGDTLLTVSHLVTGKLNDISFTLRRGEVLGVAGLVGSGRSELGEALAGRDRIHSGEIQCAGRRIGLVPEDRKEQGLMMQMSVLENSTLAVLDRMQTAGFIHDVREREALSPLARELALQCASLDAPVGSLSGGNQQKALLARWLLVNPDILFLDDPARGIDVGAKQDIYRIIDELAVSGKGVILVSSELPELLRCCDRILVLREGRLTGSFMAQEATQENIMAAAT